MRDRDLFDFLENTADAAFATTDTGEICSWNASAEALFGFERNEVLGKTCFEVFEGRGPLGALVWEKNCPVSFCAAHQTSVPAFDLEAKTRSGRRIWVNMSTVVYEDSRTNRRRIVHLARSIASQKRMEVLLGRMLRMSKQLVDLENDSVHPAPVTPLSDQEKRVLREFSEGKSPAVIVRDLKISPQTLRNHLHHINQKLRTHNRLEAVIHAVRRKLV